LLHLVHFRGWVRDAGGQKRKAGRREVGFTLRPNPGAIEQPRGKISCKSIKSTTKFSKKPVIMF
jgi:hypothetical protein